MKVISVLNFKGGVAKTTISTHLARALQLRGYDVVLVDSDPQGSSRDWAASNPEQTVPVIGIDRPTIERDLKNVAHKEFVVIDGAPQSQALAVSAMKVSDLVIIPVQPSPYDIWAASELVELIKQRIELTDGKLQAALLITRAIKGTKLSGEVRDALLEFGLPILNTAICQRVIYPSSAAEGRTVLDKEPSGEASKEINNLCDEVLSLINPVK